MNKVDVTIRGIRPPLVAYLEGLSKGRIEQLFYNEDQDEQEGQVTLGGTTYTYTAQWSSSREVYYIIFRNDKQIVYDVMLEVGS